MASIFTVATCNPLTSLHGTIIFSAHPLWNMEARKQSQSYNKGDLIQSRKKKNGGQGEKNNISLQKHLDSDFVYPSISQSKFIRQAVFYSPSTFGLRIGLDCLFYNSRQ